MASSNPAEQPQNLEVDTDSDSAFGDEASSVTTSLAESIFNYRREHGRTYHAYKDGNYFIPNDEQESDRLDLQHHLFYLTFDQKLHFAPLKEGAKHVLDVGTGTGIWAMDFADEHPEIEVVGIDLSPNQPQFVPPNLRFLVESAEDEWLWEQKFDLVHFRLLNGSFTSWRPVLESAFNHITPGGYIELQDYILPAKSNDSSIEGTDLLAWCNFMMEGAAKAGRPMDGTGFKKKALEEIGFVDVVERTFVWPTNAWPKDKKLKEIGRWNEVNITEGMEGFSYALLCRVLGWTKEEVDVFSAKVKNDLKNRSIHAYFVLPVVYGRKPEVPSSNN